MNLLAEKIQLTKMLLETEDKSLISEIKDLFKRHAQQDKLPQHVTEGIERGRQQLKNGDYVHFDDIKKELEKL